MFLESVLSSDVVPIDQLPESDIQQLEQISPDVVALFKDIGSAIVPEKMQQVYEMARLRETGECDAKLMLMKEIILDLIMSHVDTNVQDDKSDPVEKALALSITTNWLVHEVIVSIKDKTFPAEQLEGSDKIAYERLSPIINNLSVELNNDAQYSLILRVFEACGAPLSVTSENCTKENLLGRIRILRDIELLAGCMTQNDRVRALLCLFNGYCEPDQHGMISAHSILIRYMLYSFK